MMVNARELDSPKPAALAVTPKLFALTSIVQCAGVRGCARGRQFVAALPVLRDFLGFVCFPRHHKALCQQVKR